TEGDGTWGRRTTLAEPTTSTTLGEHKGTTTTRVPRTTTTTTSTTVPGSCSVVNTACGSCGNGACKPIRPSGQLICAYQTQTGCSPEACTSTAECSAGPLCVAPPR